MEATKDLVVYEARDGQEIKLSFDTIKKYLVQGHPEFVTNQEMMYFMGVCKSRGLNPFIKDCYLIKYSQKESAAIITSVDYFKKRAKVQQDCKGWQSGIIVERNGEIVYSNGIMLKDDTLLGAWFRAKPAGWDKPCEKEVNLSGYIKKTKEGNVTRFWSKENQPSQIEKVALSQGLRECWPDEFQQLYTPEEMGEADMFKTAEDVSKGQPTLNDKLKPNGKKKAEGEDVYATKKVNPLHPDKPSSEKEEDKKEPYETMARLKFKKWCKKERETISGMDPGHQAKIYKRWEADCPGEDFPSPEAVEEPLVEDQGGPDEKPDLNPILLNCPCTREEIPEKDDNEHIPTDYCENICKYERRRNCIPFAKYQDNIKTG